MGAILKIKLHLDIPATNRLISMKSVVQMYSMIRKNCHMNNFTIGLFHISAVGIHNFIGRLVVPRDQTISCSGHEPVGMKYRKGNNKTASINVNKNCSS